MAFRIPALVFLNLVSTQSLHLRASDSKSRLQIAPPREWEALTVLIFWCARFTDRNVDLLIRNLEHLKQTSVKFDLIIGHYDEQKQLWMDRNETWYREHVDWGIDRSGFKVHLLKAIREQTLAGVEFDITNYDWVWMLDEDIDITQASLEHLFRDAKSSDALIVGPAFVQKDPLVQEAFEVPYYPMNTPQSDKRYRYVPLVEIVMPLFRPEALAAFFDCADCMPPYDSDWGLDHIWCSLVEKEFQVLDRKTCAIVDHTGPIVHLNYGSTRNNESADTVKIEGQLAIGWLWRKHPDDYREAHFHNWSSWEGYREIPYEEV